jgi:hypothetical protein
MTFKRDDKRPMVGGLFGCSQQTLCQKIVSIRLRVSSNTQYAIPNFWGYCGFASPMPDGLLV